MWLGCATSVVLLQLLARLAIAEEECSCTDCCQRVPRPPSMMVAGSDTMCAAKPTDESIPLAAQECPVKCKPDPSYKVVSSTAENMDYNRYCFMYCKPQTKMENSKACQDLPAETLQKLATAGGNGMDQASLTDVQGGSEQDQEQPQASDEEAREEAAAADQAKSAVAAVMQQGVPDEGVYVAEESGKSAVAAGMEARISAAESVSMRMLAASTAALATTRKHAGQINALKGTVLSAEMQAKIYAQSAVKSLSEARKELQEIRDAAAQAAKEAGAEAAAMMNKKADEAWAKVRKFQAKFNPKGPAPMAAAANRAAAPYFAAQSKAMGIRLLYSTKAQELSQTAKDLQRNAQVLQTQAQSYAAAGSKLAPGMMNQAKGMLADATRINGEAQQWQAVAQKITQDIPQYEVAAMAAAARAAVLANPAGQPPPPEPPMMLLQEIAPRLRGQTA